MIMLEYKDIGWWYWLATVVLLTLGLSGFSLAFILAIILTAVQLIHYLIREKSIRSFPVQVRYWYLLLLLIALPEPLQFIFWIPAIGTWAQVLLGYCTMARFVSLLPWNSNEAFSAGRFMKTFFSRPVKGSVQQGFAAPD